MEPPLPVSAANAIAIAAGLFTTGALVVGVQFLPPLTTSDPASFPEFQRYRTLDGDDRVLLEAQDSAGRSTIINPQQFCREELPGVNCGCFVQRAARVMSSGNPRASGWRYANDWELAKTQAANDCR